MLQRRYAEQVSWTPDKALSNPHSKEVKSVQDPKKVRRIVGAAIGAGLGTALGGPIGAVIGTVVGHWIADQW